MKVRCIDDKNIAYGKLSLGSIYEVHNRNQFNYEVVDDLGRYVYFKKERFEEVKEDKDMKFKVGDKVRVREDLENGFSYGAWCFNAKMTPFKGKELTIEKVYDESYKVKENDWYWTDEMLEEVKGNKTEKTFREVISTIKKNETWSDGIYEISKDEDGIKIKRLDRYVQEDKNKIPFMYFYDDKKFALKRKHYSFEEAFKAYEDEEKEVEDDEGNRYRKINGLDAFYNEFTEEWENVEHLIITFDVIRKPWYIND